MIDKFLGNFENLHSYVKLLLLLLGQLLGTFWLLSTPTPGHTEHKQSSCVITDKLGDLRRAIIFCLKVSILGIPYPG